MLNNSFFRRISPFLLPGIYAFLFILLILRIKDLTLLIDDRMHILPAVNQAYFRHFAEYTYGYGLLRPLGLLFFYSIYTLYLFLPSFAHIFMFSLHFLGGYLLYIIFKKHIHPVMSALLSILFVVLPFFTEQYGWFAASNGVLANLILIVQLYVVSKNRFSFKKKVLLLFFLQLWGVLTYENIFFTFIPLVFFLPKKNILVMLLLGVPSLFYLVVRNTVLPAHSLIVKRELGLYELMNSSLLTSVINNVIRFMNDMKYLFFHISSWTFFWQENSAQGSVRFLNNPVELFLFLGAIMLLSAYIISHFIKVAHSAKTTENPHVTRLWGYLLLSLGFFLLLPNLFLKEPSFPFRVISLPIFFLISGLCFLMFHRFKQVILVGVTFAILSSTLITWNILFSMVQQGKDDTRLLSQISQIIQTYDKEPSTIVLTHVPQSTQTTFTYGEYLTSCLWYSWCVSTALGNTNSRVIINPTDLLEKDYASRLSLQFIPEYKTFQVETYIP